MITRAKSDKKEQKKGRVKIEKLKLDKETVRDLTADEVKKIRGGTGGCHPADNALKIQ